MSAGLFIVTTPTHLKQDLVGWFPCYLHRRKTVEDIISNESSKCFLQPGNCGDLLRESGLTGWDYTIAGEREGWQKSSWSLLLFFFLLFVSFLPQTGEKYFYLFWARDCFCCSLVVSCPWYDHQRHTTHCILCTERHLPQSCTCTFAHIYTLKQMHKHCSSTAEIYMQYAHKHTCINKPKEIYHISVKAAVHLSWL